MTRELWPSEVNIQNFRNFRNIKFSSEMDETKRKDISLQLVFLKCKAEFIG